MALLVFAGTFGMMGVQPALADPIIHMQDTVTTTGQSIWSGRPVHAEYVSPTSVLVGKEIDTIVVMLKQTGTPTGTAEVGIINEDLSMKHVFATLDVTTLTGSYEHYEFMTSGSPYTIQAGDRIGVKYTEGTSSNHISIMRDVDPADPFDGQNTYHTYYTTSWSEYHDYDLTMTLKLANTGTGDPITVSASHSPSSPTSSDQVTIAASATSAAGMGSIEIFVDDASIGSCDVTGSSASCEKAAGPYNEDTSHTYYATATDIDGLSASSSPKTFTVSPPETGTFTDDVFVGGLDKPTAMVFTPDGRLLIAEKAGALRVVKNDVLLPAPFLSVSVDTEGERGLIGVTIDPDFESNGYVYVQYTTSSDPIHNKVSRFTASTSNPDVAEAGSEQVLIDLDDLSGAYHNAGGLHFGSDGKLYISAGDNGHSSDAQKLTNHFGKIHRINPDGTIPSDNPFYNTSGAYKEIWALGLRNPFTFAFEPGTGKMYINDVGNDAVEEVNEGTSGGNYGWPTCEGPCSNANFIDPVYSYVHPPGEGRSITGGVFYDASQFPTEYQSNYFFADYVANFIKRLTPDNQVADFLFGTQTPVDIDVGPDGSLYYLSFSSGQVHKVQYQAPEGNQAPVAVAGATPTSGAPPLEVSFDASSSTDADGDALAYSWNFGDGSPDGSGVSATHTYENSGQYVVTLTVDDGNGGQDSDTVTITVGSLPVGVIDTPVEGTMYSAGDTISFSGSASDAEDGDLPDSAFYWEVLLHHNTHTHPFEIFEGVNSGSFTIPQLSETDHDVWYRIYLTVTDSSGLTHISTRDLLPNKVTITLDSNVSGLELTLDGQPKTTPASVVGVVGVIRELGAPLTQDSGGQTYEFESWSDGGEATHSVATPETDTTYTANYNSVEPPPTGDPVVHMEDTVTTTGQSIWSGRPVHAEYVSPTSVLVGKEIDTIVVMLKQTGSPTGTAEIGVFNSDLSVKKLFATLDVSTITTSYEHYEFAADTPYTIEAGDRIGVKYTEGTSSNHISIMRDVDPADPFDGQNTYHTYYTTSWSNFLSNDLTMTLKLVNAGSGGSDTPEVSASHSPSSPTSSDQVTIAASATSAAGMGSIEIFVDDASIGSCDVTGSSASCEKAAGPYNEDTSHTYYATATDIDGLMGSSSTGTFTVSSGSVEPAIHMEDTVTTTGQSIWSGRPVHAEYVTDSSSLVGKQINSITVMLKQTGTPTGTAEVGIINEDLSMKHVFATLDVTTLTGSYQHYEFLSTDTTPYTIQAGDRIGVKYTEGTSSNHISIMRDVDPADPFDGQNTYHTYYTTSWSNFLSNDLTMTLQVK